MPALAVDAPRRSRASHHSYPAWLAGRGDEQPCGSRQTDLVCATGRARPARRSLPPLTMRSWLPSLAPFPALRHPCGRAQPAAVRRAASASRRGEDPDWGYPGAAVRRCQRGPRSVAAVPQPGQRAAGRCLPGQRPARLLSRGLRVQRPGAGWGIAGYSEGGFCAANLGLQYSRVFSYAGVLSGYFRPSGNQLVNPSRQVSLSAGTASWPGAILRLTCCSRCRPGIRFPGSGWVLACWTAPTCGTPRASASWCSCVSPP